MATIAEEIVDLSGRVQTAFRHIEAKGGSVPVPAQQSTYELPTAIDSIPTGDSSNFYGLTSIAQAFPLSIDVETGKWVSLPAEAPAVTFKCPVKKVINPYSNVTTLTADNFQPRAFRNMFGIGTTFNQPGIQTGFGGSNGQTIRQLYSWLPNVSAIEFPELTQVSSYMCFTGFCAGNPYLKKISFPKLSATAGLGTWQAAFSYCNTLEVEGVEQFWNGLSSVTGNGGQFNSTFYVNTCTRPWHLQFNPVMNYYTDYAFYQVAGWNNISSATICVSAVGSQTTTGNHTFERAFVDSASLKEVSFPNLKFVRSNTGTNLGVFSQMCDMNDVANSQLTSVSFPELEVISGNGTAAAGLGVFRYAFRNCHKLSAIEFPKLRSIPTDYFCFTDTFNFCSSLMSVSLPELTSACQRNNAAGTFKGWMSSTTKSGRWKLYLPKMKSLLFGTSNSNNNGFGSNYGMTDIYLNSVSSITNNYGFVTCPQLSAIHFSAQYEEQIRATTGFAIAWGRGAGNVQILFDLTVPE